MFSTNRQDKRNGSPTQLDSKPITTVIGPEITFTGDIQGSQTIKIDGKIIGNVQIENGIILGEKGIVEGDLKSKSIIVYGSVRGNISCNELHLKSSGSIHGDIQTNTVEIEIGGKYNGKLMMSTANGAEKRPELQKQSS